MSMVICVSISDPQSGVNRQRTATLGAVESDEPSLAAVPHRTPSNMIHVSIQILTSVLLQFCDYVKRVN